MNHHMPLHEHQTYTPESSHEITLIDGDIAVKVVEVRTEEESNSHEVAALKQEHHTETTPIPVQHKIDEFLDKLPMEISEHTSETIVCIESPISLHVPVTAAKLRPAVALNPAHNIELLAAGGGAT